MAETPTPRPRARDTFGPWPDAGTYVLLGALTVVLVAMVVLLRRRERRRYGDLSGL